MPKFIDEDYLYPEQTEKISVFVDHYGCGSQTEEEREVSIKSILYVFENLKKYRNEIDIYFHSSKGIERILKLLQFLQIKKNIIKI